MSASSARSGGTSAGGTSGGGGDADSGSGSASSRLFDLRDLICGLFILFGIILVIAGFLDGQAELDKAAGVRINLWTGIGMIVVGIVFLIWRVLKPLRREDLPPEEPAEPGAPPVH